MEDLAALSVVRYPNDFMLARIWEMRGNVPSYDGAYLALTEALDAPLLTRDSRLARVPRIRASVELI